MASPATGEKVGDQTIGADLSNYLIKASGSTTYRSLADRAADVVNVKDFGAKGNGSTDDTAAIQTAINRAQPIGGQVFLPAGVYRVRKIEVLAGTCLSGAGRLLTVLKLVDGLTSADFVTDRTGHPFGGFVVVYNSYPSGGYNGGLPLDGITIQDLTIDGNWTAENNTFSGWGLYLNGVTRPLVRNVAAQNCLSHGFTAKECSLGIFAGLKALSNGKGTGAGDGFVLLSRCSDNIVTDSESSGNTSGGYEDEGRFGAYTPSNRNARNRWLNLLSQGNGDNGFDAIFTDNTIVENLTVVGGATGPNAAGVQLLGTTDALINGLFISGGGHEGMRLWTEIYGPAGVNVNLSIKNATIEGVPNRAIVAEAVKGGKIEATIRGVGDTHGISLNSIGYGRTGGNPATHASGGYGMGAYQVGQPYLTGATSPYGVGDVVLNAGNVYQLTAPFTGTGLSVTAPTGTTTSADNGGTWSFLSTIGSVGLDLKIDFDATVPAAYAAGQAYPVGTQVASTGKVYVLDLPFTGSGLSVTAPTGTGLSTDNGGVWRYLWIASAPSYNVYCYNQNSFTIRDSSIKGAQTYNVWLDGLAGGSAGVLIRDSRLTGSGAFGLRLTGSLLTGSNLFDSNDLSGNSSGAVSNPGGITFVAKGNLGYVTSASGLTGAIATGATVTHGLSTTPVVVTLTAADGTPTAVFPSALGASTFAVNYTGGGTHAFYWTAKTAADP